MTYSDWREPARLLKARVGPATPQQHDIAARLGLPLPKRTRALVAAALIRDRMADALIVPVRESTYTQQEFLADLEPWAKRTDPLPETFATASALIELREARRALEFLLAIKPSHGDLVTEWSPSRAHGGRSTAKRHFLVVASIAEDGMVYFAGGGGHRARISRLEVVYRSNDMSANADRARKEAHRAAQERRAAGDYSAMLSGARYKRLFPWLVPDREIYARDVDGLRGVIETAEDEAPIQKYLTAHPYLLTVLLRGSQGRWLKPETRLGDKYRADFFIADSDSTGVRWRLVELESPRVKPLLKSGEWAKEARHAQHQIRQWRHYLRENLDPARKPEKDEGLGLVDIEAGVPALILISRRNMVAEDPAWMRRDLSFDSAVEMHTYDWLIERVEERSASPSGLI